MSKFALLLAIGITTTMENPSNAETAINVWLDKGDRLQAEVTLAGKRVGKIDKVSDHEGLGREPFITFEVPLDPGQIELRGVVTIDGKAWPFKQSWRLVDMAKVTGVLHAKGKPLAERISDYCKLLKTMEAKYEDEFFADSSIAKRPGDAAAEFAAAEARLGVKFPPKLKLFAEYELKIGDSVSLRPDNWTPVKDWGNFDRLDKEVRARFARSIVVFQEVGDGIGVMAWDPRGVTPGEKSNATGDKNGPGAVEGKKDDGVWFWLHQNKFGPPELLLDRKRRPRDTESAIMSAIERQGSVGTAVGELFELGEFGNAEDDSVRTVWIDSAHPRGLLGLGFDIVDGSLDVSLMNLRDQFSTLW